ncbi:excisionase family DNA-binding protein [bacterium]|nr:excisionase family DNA-binding protein [bacterium]
MDYLTIQACLDLPATKSLDRRPSRHTIKRAITDGRLPAIKPGQDYLIKKADYLQWLSGFPHKPGRQTQ